MDLRKAIHTILVWTAFSASLFLVGFPATGQEQPRLNEDQRSEIWHLEHQVNVLKQRGLQPMAGHLTARDRNGLESHFENKQDATPLLELLETYPSKVHAAFSIRSLTRGTSQTEPETWKAELSLRLWSTDPRYTEAHTEATISFRSPVQDDEPWCESFTVSSSRQQSTDRPYFRENGTRRGLPHDLHDNWKPDSITALATGGVFVEDINRDGFLDVLLSDIRWPETLRLYAGSSEGKFHDRTTRAGLDRLPQTDLLAVFFDWNGDGWVDLLHGSTPWINKEGVFTIDSDSNLETVINEAGYPNPPVSYHPADFDLDGKIDLYVTRLGVGHARGGSFLGGRAGPMAINQLLKNLGDGQFRDVTEGCRVTTNGFSSFSAAWFHANGDLYPDLYVLHEFGGGALFINNEGKNFSRKQLAPPGGDFGSMGIATGDINRDGNMDLYISSMYSKAGKRVFQHLDQNSYPADVMNQLSRLSDGSECYLGPDFSTAGQRLGIAEVGWGWGAAFADVDNDGWSDLYATNGFVSRDRSKPDG